MGHLLEFQSCNVALAVDEVDGSWWEEVTSSAPDPVKDWGEITPLNGRK